MKFLMSPLDTRWNIDGADVDVPKKFDNIVFSRSYKSNTSASINFKTL